MIHCQAFEDGRNANTVMNSGFFAVLLSMMYVAFELAYKTDAEPYRRYADHSKRKMAKSISRSNLFSDKFGKKEQEERF